MKKVAFVAMVLTALIFFLVKAYQPVTSEGIRLRPVEVAEEDIQSLVACMKENRCNIMSTDIIIDGRHAISLTLDLAENAQVRYVLFDDKSLKIMLTVDKDPIMIEDFGLTGKVDRIAEMSSGEPQLFEQGVPGFENRLPYAQHMYYKAMEKAKKLIIPEDGLLYKKNQT